MSRKFLHESGKSLDLILYVYVEAMCRLLSIASLAVVKVNVSGGRAFSHH